MTALRWTLLATAIVITGLIATAAWVVHTPSGTAWVTARAEQFLAGRLELGEVRGTLAGPLELARVRWRDPETGLEARLAHVTADLAPRALLGGVLRIESLAVRDVRVRLGRPKEDEEPFSLEPPIDVVVEHARLEHARLEDAAGETVLTITRAELAGAWTDAGIDIDTLELRAPEGAVTLAGHVAQRDQQYFGRAQGRFRWQAGGREYAGELRAQADAPRAEFDVRLSAPFAARLDAALAQEAPQRWHFTLDVPKFDPRRQLMPDGSLESLAARLEGRGDRDDASIEGIVTIGGDSVRLASLRLAWQEGLVRIETLTVVPDAALGQSARLHAHGTVRLPEEQPPLADLLVSWRDVVLPERWAGQRLATRGELAAKGTAQSFAVHGEFAAGPPGELADIRLALRGSPQRLDIERLDLVQGRARFAASGQLQLQREMRWNMRAEAQDFDPGRLLAGWPGQLSFTLASEGRLSDEGPVASVELTRLRGVLRNRALSGRADLEVAPGYALSGSARLRSGRSTIAVVGRSRRELDATLTFDLVSLADWLPGAGGRLRGHIQARGLWPQLAIVGDVQGRDLAFADLRAERLAAAVDVRRAERLAAAVDVRNPREPEGTIRIRVAKAAAGGFSFDTIELAGEGGRDGHTLALDAYGEPLGAEMRVSGTLDGPSWSGRLEALVLESKRAGRYALVRPAALARTPEGFRIGETCLADGGTRVCIEGSGSPAGALSARYEIEAVPLALLAAIGAPQVAWQVAGTLAGRGELQRTAAGALYGSARIVSASGSVTEPGAGGNTLLRYRNLEAHAQLSGDRASIDAAASLFDAGELSASARLTELTSAAPSIEGKGRIVLPSLAPAALLAPRLANVRGRAEARARVAGTLAAPEFAGEIAASRLGAELPEIGLDLHDGELHASLRDGGALTVEGSIVSGEGRLQFEGGGRLEEAVRLRIHGENVLAAQIPAARVVVSPALTFVRTPQGMALEGKVTVPAAKVDLTKLPGGGQAKASPDVVVVDATEPAKDGAAGLPLTANITFVIGDEVELVGFGLAAQLGGQLQVRESPGREAVGSGEIHVAKGGTYRAYGQNLEIERGRLQFAGTPLDDPGLDILAVRKLPDVRAELRVTGTAQQPILTVSSDPAMSQSEALSYLVTGKPLHQLGQGEGDLLQSAARSLGGAAGNLLAKNIGRRLGVDELAIEQDEQIGGSALTIGEYLSPRLYLSYGVGLFEPGEVMTLRYRLTEQIAIEASQGPEGQRTGIEYRIER